MAGNNIFGSNYIPFSELVTENHPVKKSKFDVIDVHSHWGHLLMGDDYCSKYDTSDTVKLLRECGISHIINLDGFWGKRLDDMLKKTEGFEEYISTFCSVDFSGIHLKNFEKATRNHLVEAKKRGVKGIKVWKNVSLNLKIPIDSEKLKAIWETAAELDLPVLIHIADPTAFFKPIDKFNERYDELIKRPEWSFYGDEFYGFEELMAMQENLLKKNPGTTFIVAHAGSCSENLQYVRESLDRFSNMYIDFAERIQELGRQPYTARSFFNRYQDRILFGSDTTPLTLDYEPQFRFLETWDEYFDYTGVESRVHGNWKIYGLGLEDEILKKIYHANAQKLLNIN